MAKKAKVDNNNKYDPEMAAKILKETAVLHDEIGTFLEGKSITSCLMVLATLYVKICLHQKITEVQALEQVSSAYKHYKNIK